MQRFPGGQTDERKVGSTGVAPYGQFPHQTTGRQALDSLARAVRPRHMNRAPADPGREFGASHAADQQPFL
jgi:hypothetical protein